MKDSLLLGLGRHMIPIPRMVWERVVKARARKTGAGLGFMSEDHHRVRDFAVLELARAGAPLAPEKFAEALDLAVPRVVSILEELEEHLTFVFRGDRRVVTWAYPVTVDETPHRASFSTGEEAYSP
jgi:hypothetical protein